MTEYVKKSDVLELLSLPKDLIAEYVCDLKGLWIDDDEAEQTEPQTNADQHTQCVESVETMSCQECKHWIFDDRWGWFCPLKSQDECRYEPKTEPQTDGYMTAEQAEDYRKMLDKAEHKVYGNIETEPQSGRNE